MVRAVPFILLLTLVACSRSESAPEAPAATESPAPVATESTPMPAGALPGAGPAEPAVPAELPAVIARVNGDEISKADFEKAIRTLEGRAGGPVPTAERDRIYRRVLDELISMRLLLQESRSRKIQVPDAEVEAQIASIRQQFPSEEAFTGMLAAQKLTIEDVRADMRNDMTISKLLEAEIAPKVSVKDSEISEFYKQNPTEFQVPQQVRASHILISAPAAADAATRQAAREKAAGILKRARSGEDFAALAKEFSQDPGSAANGGDLGFFKEGDMVGPFNDTAFSLAPGTISDLVETDFGVHIIKVLEKQPARAVSLEEARPSIQQYLQDMSRRQHTQQFVQSLRTKGKIDVFI